MKPLQHRLISFLAAIAFAATLIVPIPSRAELLLPAPGTLVTLSPAADLPILKGIKVHADNPLKFEFILDNGRETGEVALKEQSSKLIKYFLASLTTPEQEMWVNLSPYEKDRIVPDSFGQTEMGRDLLAQDYLLKQITASLVYPEGDIGKQFWKRVYELSGNKNVPVNTFNKVWIVPDKAVVYENAKNGTAYVVESSLKVLTEQDYLAQDKNAAGGAQAVRFARSLRGTMALSSATPRGDGLSEDETNSWATGPAHAIRDLVIPQLTKEVNEGKNFAQLRQVYNSLILATWYKKKIKDSILSQVYADKNKVDGITIDDPKEKERIYAQYLEAFKKGAYNYIKEERDPLSGQVLPRKYFSGGVKFGDLAMTTSAKPPQQNVHQIASVVEVRIDQLGAGLDNAMTAASLQGERKDPLVLKGKIVERDTFNHISSMVRSSREATPRVWEISDFEKVLSHPLQLKQFVDLPLSVAAEVMIVYTDDGRWLFCAAGVEPGVSLDPFKELIDQKKIVFHMHSHPYIHENRTFGGNTSEYPSLVDLEFFEYYGGISGHLSREGLTITRMPPTRLSGDKRGGTDFHYEFKRWVWKEYPWLDSPLGLGKESKKAYKDYLRSMDVDINIVPWDEGALRSALSGAINQAMMTKARILQDPLQPARDRRIPLDKEALKPLLKGKTILITGGGGSIGSALAFEILKEFGDDIEKIVLFGQGSENLAKVVAQIKGMERSAQKVIVVTGDVSRLDQIEPVFKEYSPQIVYHLAAETSPVITQADPSRAIAVNVFGTHNMVALADRYSTEHFIYTSSSKATNVLPDSVLGQTKRLAEYQVQLKARNSRTQFGIVRFVHTLDTRASLVMKIFQDKIDRHEPLPVMREAATYFQNTHEAVNLALNVLLLSRKGEIFALSDVGRPVKIEDIARYLLSQNGKGDEQIKFIPLREGEVVPVFQHEDAGRAVIAAQEYKGVLVENKAIAEGVPLAIDGAVLSEGLERLHSNLGNTAVDLKAELVELMKDVYGSIDPAQKASEDERQAYVTMFKDKLFGSKNGFNITLKGGQRLPVVLTQSQQHFVSHDPYALDIVLSPEFEDKGVLEQSFPGLAFLYDFTPKDDFAPPQGSIGQVGVNMIFPRVTMKELLALAKDPDAFYEFRMNLPSRISYGAIYKGELDLDEHQARMKEFFQENYEKVRELFDKMYHQSPILVITYNQASGALRSSSKNGRMFPEWIEAVHRHILEAASSMGIKDIYAIPSDLAAFLYPGLKNEDALRLMYDRPYQSKPYWRQEYVKDDQLFGQIKMEYRLSGSYFWKYHANSGEDHAQISDPTLLLNTNQKIFKNGVRLVEYPSSDDVTYYAARRMADVLITNNALKRQTRMITPTGGTYEPVYAAFVRIVKEEGIDCSNLITYNMDEYYVGQDGAKGRWDQHPQSYRQFMEKHLYAPLREIGSGWNNDNGHVLNGNAVDIDAEVRAYEQAVREGGIDIAFGGIGRDGHIAFNEPIITVSAFGSIEVEKARDFNEFLLDIPPEKQLDLLEEVLTKHWAARRSSVFAEYLRMNLVVPYFPATLPDDLAAFMEKLLRQPVVIYFKHLDDDFKKVLEKRAANLASMMGGGSVTVKELKDPADMPTRVVHLALPTLFDNSRFLKEDIKNMRDIPLSALTVGPGTLRHAKEIVVAATGAKKAEAVTDAALNKPTPDVSASLLQGHQNLTFVFDTSVAESSRPLQQAYAKEAKILDDQRSLPPSADAAMRAEGISARERADKALYQALEGALFESANMELQVKGFGRVPLRFSKARFHMPGPLFADEYPLDVVVSPKEPYTQEKVRKEILPPMDFLFDGKDPGAFYPPKGSFGQIGISLVSLDHSTALLINYNQASNGLRSSGKDGRPFIGWVEAAHERIIEAARSVGIQQIYALPSKAAGKLYYGLESADAVNLAYEKPYQNKEHWKEVVVDEELARKIKVGFNDHEQPFLWKYDLGTLKETPELINEEGVSADWLRGMFELDSEGRMSFASGFNGLPLLFDLYYVRHGQTKGNLEGILQGQQETANSQLTDEGISQAKQAAVKLFDQLGLAKSKPSRSLVIVTSQLNRTKETADFFVQMLKDHGVPFEIVDDQLQRLINELNVGAMGNKKELMPQEQDLLKRYMAANAKEKFPRGESFVDLILRARQWLLKMNEQYQGRTVVVFGHGNQSGALRALLGDRTILNGEGSVDWINNKLPNALPVQLSSGFKADAAMRAEDIFDFEKDELKVVVLERKLQEVMLKVNNGGRAIIVGGTRYFNSGQRKDVDVLLKGMDMFSQGGSFVAALKEMLLAYEGVRIDDVIDLRKRRVIIKFTLLGENHQSRSLSIDLIGFFDGDDAALVRRLKEVAVNGFRMHISNAEYEDKFNELAVKDYFEVEYYLGDRTVYEQMLGKFKDPVTIGEFYKPDGLMANRMMELRSKVQGLTDQQIAEAVDAKLAVSADMAQRVGEPLAPFKGFNLSSQQMSRLADFLGVPQDVLENENLVPQHPERPSLTSRQTFKYTYLGKEFYVKSGPDYETLLEEAKTANVVHNSGLSTQAAVVGNNMLLLPEELRDKYADPAIARTKGFMLVTKGAQGESWFSILKKGNKITYQMVVDLARAMGRLHAQGLAHNDLYSQTEGFKTEHIFQTSQGVEFIDFGLTSRLWPQIFHESEKKAVWQALSRMVDAQTGGETLKKVFDDAYLQGFQDSERRPVSGDAAMAKGGIDLNAGKLDLQTRHEGKGLEFKTDPALLKRLQNASGFTPVIINIRPLGDLNVFLGVSG